MAQTSLLILGATGYIGGSLLVDLKKRYPDFIYTALVRNDKNNKAIGDLGVKVVNGSHSQTDLVEKLAKENDIVVEVANADDLPLTEAILRGLTTRAKENPGGRKPLLIHTSGTGLHAGRLVEGQFIPSDGQKVWDDNILEDVKGIPDDALHRNVDLEVFKAGSPESGLIDTYIVVPSTVYGKGYGPVRNTSLLVTELVKVGKSLREVIYPGDGKNTWNSVHIKDLNALYILVLDLALSGKDAGTDAYTHFYYGSSDTIEMGRVTGEVAKILHSKGLVDKDTATSVALDDPRLTFFLGFTSTTAKTVANRSFKLGWKPSQKNLYDTLPEDVDNVLSQL